jgi:hypothetical protein
MARSSSPGRVAVIVIVVLCAAVVPVLLYLLWEFWPTAAILKVDTSPVTAFGIRRDVSTEVRLFIVVAIAGALGGVMHSTRSVAWYVGHQNLKWRWVPFYLLTIVLGAGLASIFYLLIRGGLFQGAGLSDANPYGFTALGALVGLFTEQALVMLRNVATQVFAHAETGSDSTELMATTGDAVNVGETTATLVGEVTSQVGSAMVYFEYGTDTSYGLRTAEQPAEQPGVSADVTDLAPGTEYHFRLVAKNEAGATAEGDDNTFTTQVPAG